MKLAAAGVNALLAIICAISIFIIPLNAPMIYVTCATCGMILFALAAGIFLLMQAETPEGEENE